MIMVNHDMNPLVQDMPKQKLKKIAKIWKHSTPSHYIIPIVMLKQKANTLAGTAKVVQQK